MSVTRGTLEIRRGGVDYAFELIDLPGLYSLTETTETARRGARFIIEQADAVINVTDATNLKQSLYLTMQLSGLGIPMLMALNMFDEAGYHGVTINLDQLSTKLEMPVVPTIGISGGGISTLIDKLVRLDMTPRPVHNRLRPDWSTITQLINTVQTIKKRSKRLVEHIATMSVHPLWGTVLAGSVFVATLITIFYLSGYLESGMNFLFTTLLTTPLTLLHSLLAWSPFLQQTLVGTITPAGIDFETAMGLFTTGIYIPLGQVAPPVIAFYSIMGLLEDSG